MDFSYWQLLGTVAPVLLVIAVGFILRRGRWLTAEADRSLLRVSVNVLYPCLIAETVLGNQALKNLQTLLLSPAVGFGTIVLGYGLSLLAARLFRLRAPNQARAFAFATGTYNYGYIPIPIVLAFFDRQTMGVLFAFTLGVELALWTVGVLIVRGGSGRLSWRSMLTPPVIAIAISLLLNLSGADAALPKFALQTAHMLGQSAVPLALVLTGATLADLLGQMPLKAAGLVASAAVGMRLGVLPLLFLFLAWALPASPELKRIIVIQAAMPAAMLPIVLTRHYGGDAGTALQVVLATTALGLITIPFWLQIGFRLIQ